MRISYPKLLFSAALALFLVVLVVNIGLSQEGNPTPYPLNSQQAGILDTVKKFFFRSSSSGNNIVLVPYYPSYVVLPADKKSVRYEFSPGQSVRAQLEKPFRILNVLLQRSDGERTSLLYREKTSSIIFDIPSDTPPGAHHVIFALAGEASQEVSLLVKDIPRVDASRSRQARASALGASVTSPITYRGQICIGACYWEMVFAGHPTDSNKLVHADALNSVIRTSTDAGRTWGSVDISVLTGSPNYPNGELIIDRYQKLVNPRYRPSADPQLKVLNNGAILHTRNAALNVERQNFNVLGILTGVDNFSFSVGLLSKGDFSGNVPTLLPFQDYPYPNIPLWSSINAQLDRPVMTVDPDNQQRIFISVLGAPRKFVETEYIFSDIIPRHIKNEPALHVSDDGGLTYARYFDLPLFNSMTVREGKLYGVSGDVNDVHKAVIYRFNSFNPLQFDILSGPGPIDNLNWVRTSLRENTQLFIPTHFVILSDGARSSPHYGRLYLIFTRGERISTFFSNNLSYSYAEDTNIFLSYSDDGGNSWSASRRIDDDSSGGDQFFPSAFIDSNGTVHMTFLDHRNNKESGLLEMYYTKTSDGIHFSKNLLISGESIPIYFGEAALGHYLETITAYNDRVFIALPCGFTQDNRPRIPRPSGACMVEINPRHPDTAVRASIHEVSSSNLTGAFAERVYTTSEEEKQILIAQGGQESGNFGSVYLTPVENSFPLYRLVLKRTGTHFYGTEQERDQLASQDQLLKNEGIFGYVAPSGPPEAKIFRMYSPTLDRYVLTHDTILRQTLLSRGFREELSFYIASGPGSTPSTGITPSTPQTSTLSQPSLSSTLSLKKGQTFVSSPLVENAPIPLSSLKTTCKNLRASRYDNVKKIYTNADTLTGRTSEGYRITTDNDCAITLTGDRQRTISDFTGMQMRTGINIIGAPSTSIRFDQIKSSCQTSRAPITVEGNKSRSSATLDPGRGYLVIVQKDCTLGGGKSSAVPTDIQTGSVSATGPFLEYFFEVLSGRR